MRKPSLQSMVLGACLFAMGTATGLFAETFTDSLQRVELKRADVSGANNMEIIVSTAEYKPGESIDRHAHHGMEAAYIIQGSDVQVPGKPPMALATGTSLLNLRDVKHAGFKVVGSSSLKLFTVHVVDKGAPLYDYAN
jgi:quercetin dioxygenase-like cupin family protein